MKERLGESEESLYTAPKAFPSCTTFCDGGNLGGRCHPIRVRGHMHGARASGCLMPVAECRLVQGLIRDRECPTLVNLAVRSSSTDLFIDLHTAVLRAVICFRSQEPCATEKLAQRRLVAWRSCSFRERRARHTQIRFGRWCRAFRTRDIT